MNKKSGDGIEREAPDHRAKTALAASRTPRGSMSLKWLQLLTVLFVIKSAVQITTTYTHYFPPDFQSLFLTGRQSYFFDGYHVAFYAHILAGPATLLFGLILLHRRTRQRLPRFHRTLGRIQVALVLLLLTPGGLLMAWKTETGLVAGLAFGCLAVATAITCLAGWRTAMRRQLAAHQRWMLRNYVLLCSAIVLRVLGGMATIAGVSVTWSYPLSAWLCWLGPLAICEFQLRQVSAGQGGSVRTPATVSSPKH